MRLEHSKHVSKEILLSQKDIGNSEMLKLYPIYMLPFLIEELWKDEDNFILELISGGCRFGRTQCQRTDEFIAYIAVEVHREDVDYICLDDLSDTEEKRGNGIGANV